MGSSLFFFAPGFCENACEVEFRVFLFILAVLAKFVTIKSSSEELLPPSQTGDFLLAVLLLEAAGVLVVTGVFTGMGSDSSLSAVSSYAGRIDLLDLECRRLMPSSSSFFFWICCAPFLSIFKSVSLMQLFSCKYTMT